MCSCGADKRPGFYPCCKSLKILHPIGIMPEKIWIEHRVMDISDAVVRYLNVNKKVPEEWYEERNRHINWLNQNS